MLERCFLIEQLNHQLRGPGQKQRSAVQEHSRPVLGGLRHDLLQLGSLRFAVRVKEPRIHKNILQGLLVGAQYRATFAEMLRQDLNRCAPCGAACPAAQKQLTRLGRRQVCHQVVESGLLDSGLH